MIAYVSFLLAAQYLRRRNKENHLPFASCSDAFPQIIQSCLNEMNRYKCFP